MTQNLTYKKFAIRILSLFFGLFIVACSSKPTQITEASISAKILPDYSDVSIPVNIAPLNFIIQEEAEHYLAQVGDGRQISFSVQSSDGTICFPQKKWKQLLLQQAGKELVIDLFTKKDGKWLHFLPLRMPVINTPIDSYLVYRLIEPGFESWNEMGIYQRCLENFEQSSIMQNKASDKNCMNCHSFCKNQAETMLFHMRAQHAGTVLLQNGQLKKVDTTSPHTLSPGVYPAWHPNGKLVAFSTNRIVQHFHANPHQMVEVSDTLSDLIIYDTTKEIIFNCPYIASPESFETFPAWSPDGRFLYFCSAQSKSIDQWDEIRYDLMRIEFDAFTNTFGQTDTIIRAVAAGKSVSFPRLSPDGRFLLYTQSNFGNFSIWHPESDLHLYELDKQEHLPVAINSEQAESSHSWSSNSRWIVFSSRRMDGMYTHPYIAYVDENGQTGRPFLLPQKDPRFYSTFTKSFNVPELVKSKVQIGTADIVRLNRQAASKVNFLSEKIQTEE